MAVTRVNDTVEVAAREGMNDYIDDVGGSSQTFRPHLLSF